MASIATSEELASPLTGRVKDTVLQLDGSSSDSESDQRPRSGPISHSSSSASLSENDGFHTYRLKDDLQQDEQTCQHTPHELQMHEEHVQPRETYKQYIVPCKDKREKNQRICANIEGST